MKVVSVKFNKSQVPTFDIEVKERHNYVLGNGCVVHNSSISSETTNSLYPARKLSLVKTSGDTTNRWVAPNATKLKDNYELAWNIDNKHLIEMYAIVQKFTDQGISADLFIDRTTTEQVSMAKLIQETMWLCKYGVKSRYYYNSEVERTVDIGDKLDTSSLSKTNHDDGDVSCSGGGCSL